MRTILRWRPVIATEQELPLHLEPWASLGYALTAHPNVGAESLFFYSTAPSERNATSTARAAGGAALATTPAQLAAAAAPAARPSSPLSYRSTMGLYANRAVQ